MNKRNYLYICLLPFIFTGCQSEETLDIANTNRWISKQIESNMQIINNNELFVEKLKDLVIKNAVIGSTDNSVETIVNPILVTANPHAQKRMPITLGEEIVNTRKYEENTIIDFLKREWSLVPGFNFNREIASYALTKEINYKETSASEGMKEAMEIINDVTNEYGYPIVSKNATDVSIESITGKNYLKLFDCGTFYVAHFVTNDDKYQSISNVLLFISKEHYQDTSERVSKLISGLENDAKGLGVTLDILKQNRVNGKIITFGTVTANSDEKTVEQAQEKIGLNLMAMPAPEKEEQQTNATVIGEVEMADTEDANKKR